MLLKALEYSRFLTSYFHIFSEEIKLCKSLWDWSADVWTTTK